MGKNHNKIDLTGLRFDRWLVISEGERSKSGCIMWSCICDCGKIGNIRGTELRQGLSKSCGCYSREQSVLNATKHGAAKMGFRTPEYNSWGAMKERCYNSKNNNYEDYGGRGIIVCDRWLGENGFTNFLADMGEKPTKNHSIDRIDFNGNYELGNCKWSTRKEQNQNTRRNVWLECNGEKMLMVDWSKKLNVHYSNISVRLKRGESFESIVEYYQNKKAA